MGTGDLCRVPLAAVHHGRARQISGTGPCGYCRRVLWVAYPEVKVQVRDLVRVVCIVAPFAPRGQYSGKIRFIEPQGVNGHRGPVPGAPSSGTPRESQAKFRDGAVWVL